MFPARLLPGMKHWRALKSKFFDGDCEVTLVRSKSVLRVDGLSPEVIDLRKGSARGRRTNAKHGRKQRRQFRVDFNIPICR